MAPYQIKRHLSFDLFIEILCRLPVKSLLRFRCVSKPWLALVDNDANFAQLHLKTFNNNADQSRLFVVRNRRYGKHEGEVRDSDTFELIPGILSPPTGYYMTYFSIDGLILLESTAKRLGQFSDLKVWNPSIRKLIEIPVLYRPELSSPGDFAFDINIGLGYDPVTHNYKLIKLIFVNDTVDSVAIHVLGADSWRTINIQGYNWHWNVYGSCETVYYRGSLYFMDPDKGGVCYLARFDLSKEVLSSIRLPDHPNMGLSHYEYWRLAFVNGGFAVEACNMNSSDIYMWDVDNESMCWTKPHLYSLKGCHVWHMKKNGDILTGRIYNDDHGEEEAWDELGSYNCDTKEHKILQRRCEPYIFHVSCYVESLILHKLIR